MSIFALTSGSYNGITSDFGPDNSCSTQLPETKHFIIMKTIEEVKKIMQNLQYGEFWGEKEIPNVEEEFKKIILARIEHCSKKLEWLSTIHAKNSGYIVWHEDWGHFSYPVYERLIEATKQSLEDWDKLVWQQIVREYSDKEYNKHLFMYATEKLLVMD